MVEDFDSIGTELHKGISLIEASAGTGKTYTIAMLVLRLVVEQDIPIDKLVVVTFTKAATEELKDRIRKRLADAKQALATPVFDTDPIIRTWLDQVALQPEMIKRRLDSALLDIDQAGIFTIHGFCQRVLREHALASGQLFDAELTDDLAAVKQACADDFWRRSIQNRTAWEAAVLTKDFKTPESLLNSVVFVDAEALVYPEIRNLDEALFELKQIAGLVHDKLSDTAVKLTAEFSGPKFKASFQASFNEYLSQLQSWLQNDNLYFPSAEALNVFTFNGLLNGLDGNQFRHNKTQTKSPDERKADYIASLNIDTQAFDNLAKKSQEITVVLRRNLLETLRVELDKQLENMNAWSFDNLITHLVKALQDNSANKHLIAELRERFHAALIDEFQDTDNNQWHIFSTLFASNSHYLVLVGDPKQAIYKFRGADIYSYLEAQTLAQQRFTLRYNWRSHPRLVAAVNRLFQRDQVFKLPEIAFTSAKPALTEEKGALHFERKACPPAILWQLPESDSKSGYWQPNRNDAARLIQTAIANEIVVLFSDSYTVYDQNENGHRNLQPQDIAILVRTNQQALEYQELLGSAGVPSVLNSTESVFATEEAIQLYTLLLAVAHPGDIDLLGQALALSWFGYDGQGLYRTLNSEIELDSILARFLGYYQLWLQAGVMAMAQTLLQQEKVFEFLSKSPHAERHLTNLQHLLELLQQAVIEERLGIHKTLDWLKAAVTKAKANSSSPDSQQLRLESDADAVKIITMHRAKGLEFPIVFCPHLWQGNHRGMAKNPVVRCHEADKGEKKFSRSIVDLGSKHIDAHLAQAQFEEQAEDVRIAYVALTRAKYRCYIVWANVRSENKANDSALAWLLSCPEQNFAELDFSSQQAVLQGLQTENESVFSYRLLDTSVAIDSIHRQSKSSKELSAIKRRRSLYTDWQMSSYTALSALSSSDTPELPTDKADETQNVPMVVADPLPTGALTGNVVHELLESIPFVDLANHCDISALRNLTCQRYGLRLEKPELIDKLLQKTVSTPLSKTDARFCLMNMPDTHCLKEMPFYLSVTALNTQKINDILGNKPTFQPLTHKQMNGFLTGFIDLICEYAGRFYVMDYKSNSLPDYQHENLIRAMREHNYGLQYWIYTVVLHRYLQDRVEDYRFNTHFGGVRYLFLRGMEPDIAMSGVFTDSPDENTIEMLSGLFGE